MDIEQIGQLGQTVLVWVGILGAIWGLLKTKGIVRVSEQNKIATTADRVLWVLERAADMAVAATEQEWAKRAAPTRGDGTPDVEAVRAVKLGNAAELVRKAMPKGIAPGPEQITAAVEAAVARMKGKAAGNG